MAEMLSLNRLNQNRWICWCGFWNVSYTPTLCWCAYSPCFSMGFLMLMRISPRISWRGSVHRKPLRLRGNNWFPVFFFPSIEWVTSMFLYKADFFSIRNWINIVTITKKLISPSYMFVLTDFLPSSKTHRFWWGGVGWGNNVHWHLHTYGMLRHCPFFCNFHTYVMLRHCTFFCNFHTYVMLRWGGVGWGNNVHCHFHTYMMLRHCPFFCNFHTYVMLRHCTFFCNFHTYVMLRWGGVGWGNNVHCNLHTWCYATARSSATATFIKQLSWFDFGPLEEEKTLRGLSMEKLNPQVRRPLFFSQNWRFAMAKQ